VDPLLGGNGAWPLMVAELHRRGMRLILRWRPSPLRACGFWPSITCLENGPLSPLTWIWFSTWSKLPLKPYGGAVVGGGGAAAKDGFSCGYHCWWNDPAPAAASNHCQPGGAAAYLLAVARQLELPPGWDGLALEMCRLEVPDDFWREFPGGGAR